MKCPICKQVMKRVIGYYDNFFCVYGNFITFLRKRKAHLFSKLDTIRRNKMTDGSMFGENETIQFAMPLSDLSICLDCNWVFDWTYQDCPKCGAKTVWPLSNWLGAKVKNQPQFPLLDVRACEVESIAISKDAEETIFDMK